MFILMIVILIKENTMKISRKTKQKELLHKEMQAFNSWFNAEDLYERVKKKDEKIGIATIYRFLSDLRDKQEIYSYMCDRKTIYSRSKKSHCHFICENTGKVIHFDIDSLDFLKDKIPGEISSFQIEVTGVLRE